MIRMRKVLLSREIATNEAASCSWREFCQGKPGFRRVTAVFLPGFFFAPHVFEQYLTVLSRCAERKPEHFPSFPSVGFRNGSIPVTSLNVVE